MLPRMNAATLAFALSYVAAMAASVTMVLYAKDVRARGETSNPHTSGMMIVANLLKAPLTVREWQDNKTTYTLLLLVGVGVANIIWATAFYYSV